MDKLKMTPFLSDKIKVLSLISIILVIYIHTYYAEGKNYNILYTLEVFWGAGIATIAVPLFYVISGYLFFLGIENNKFSILEKIRKRVNTLFVPYIIANTLTFIFYVILNIIALQIPVIDKVVNFKVLETFKDGFFQVISDIFWSPIAFQLWFLRDLMLVVLLTPLLYHILKLVSNLKYGLFIVIIVEGIFAYFSLSSSFFIALFWFFLGSVFSTNKNLDIVNVSRYKLLGYINLAFFLLIILVNTLKETCVISFKFVNIIPITNFFGISAVWILYDVWIKGKLLCNVNIVGRLCKFTFFFYIIHEPILNIFKKVPLLINRSEIMLTLSYVFVPLVFISCMYLVGDYLKKRFPKIYKVYTGGR